LRQRNVTPFTILLFILVSVVVLKNVCDYLGRISLDYQNRQIAHRFRCLLFERYLSFGKLYFDRIGTARMAQVLIGRTTQIAERLQQLSNFLNALFMMLVYFCMMVYVSWQLTMLFLVMFPVLNLSTRWIIVRIRRTSEYDAKWQVQLSRKMLNTLGCIPLVKAYRQEKKEQDENEFMSLMVSRAGFSMDKKINLIIPIQEMMVLGSILMMISFIMFLMFKKQAGEVSSYLVYFYTIRRALTSMGTINYVLGKFATSAGPFREVLKILKDKKKPFVSEGKETFEGLKESIEFRNLSFSYSAPRDVLRGLNFTITRGTMTALVGPSSAGKSTIINLLMRFYECPPGSIFLDGRDIREFTLDSLMKQIAWVGQDTHLFDDTLISNLTYGLGREVTEEEIWVALGKARLESFVRKLPRGLDMIVGEKGVRLSGGEKQRLSIARAILKDTPILLLDEATSSLDTATEKLIQEALDDLFVNRTVVVVAHRLSTIQKANWVVYLENGTIQEKGTPEELLARKGKFCAAWEAQAFF